jgi:hypothetical protein
MCSRNPLNSPACDDGGDGDYGDYGGCC